MLKTAIASAVFFSCVGGVHAQAMDHSRMDHGAHMANMPHGQRQADVAQRGKDVMPFSLAATTHIFSKTNQGGIQQVVVKDASDAEQVKLTRLHLREIREQFLKGDFSGPTRIHGQYMPGLAELKAARSGQITITYAELKEGAELRYTTANTALVSALHRWFDAQLADHGTDSRAGHAGHGGVKKP
ncbi:aspartate carbamoyltransferase [Hydrogenophaga sp. BPS33]|uniref:aspartate carbamoyltransferase n=1 Tax=Hydrogenophaga sp. BPS33 TaxID=2651974 RepID=UPI0013201745|nr:aspartate carbamoyltransferase [Hydrogenophaga sp. BPS33]QHE85319.1 aspartate carbamoyltransferase [Hydrogenophaga sp. BPS33]